MAIKYIRKSVEHYEYPQVSIFDDIKGEQLDSHLAFSARKDVILYIHIPFCCNNCIFCNYYKEGNFSRNTLFHYFQAIKRELLKYTNFISSIRAIQFGGGTPTCIPLSYYNDLLSFIKDNFLYYSEISIESDIQHLRNQKVLASLNKLGINRVSFGVQSLKNETRQILGLPYRKDALLKYISDIVCSSKLDCNIDLMYNLPSQSPEDFICDIYDCFSAGINCIDMYHLNAYPGTKIHRLLHDHRILSEYYSLNRQGAFYNAYKQLINDPHFFFCASNTISQKLEKANPYISMQLGAVDCWQVGVGASARGFVGNVVYRNHGDINQYVSAVNNFGYGIRSLRICSDLSRRQLVLMPNLLKKDISNLELTKEHNNLINSLVAQGILWKSGSTINLNSDYYFYAGNVSFEFYTKNDCLLAQKIVMENYQKGLNMYNQDKMNMR